MQPGDCFFDRRANKNLKKLAEIHQNLLAFQERTCVDSSVSLNLSYIRDSNCFQS